MRTLLLFLTVLVFSSSSCERRLPGPEIKIYISKPAQGGLVRTQENEFINYSDSENYRAMSKEHFDALVNWCLNPDVKLRSKRKRRNFINNMNLILDQ